MELYVFASVTVAGARAGAGAFEVVLVTDDVDLDLSKNSMMSWENIECIKGQD